MFTLVYTTEQNTLHVHVTKQVVVVLKEVFTMKTW
jgi:hypothetical protein